MIPNEPCPVDSTRRALLGSALAPGIKIGGYHLRTQEDVAIPLVFSGVMMVLAVRAFETQE